MTSRIALALLLAACGDDGGVHSLPDAPIVPDGPTPDQPIDAVECSVPPLGTGTRGLVFAPDGTLYFSSGADINLIPPCQTPREWVTVGTSSISRLMIDPPNHALYAAQPGLNQIVKIDLDAALPTAVPYATVDDCEGLTLGPDGALWATTSDGVVRITAENTVTPVTTTVLDNPKGLAFRADGSLLVAEYSGPIFALQIAGGVETSRTMFAAELPEFHGLEGIALDAGGNVFVTNGDGGSVMVQLDPTGQFVDRFGESTGGQLDFGAGPVSHRDLYIAISKGFDRFTNTVAGAAVPWHAM